MKEESIRFIPIFAVIIAGLFALFQIRSNNITNARLRWLENFKQLITDFIAEITSIQLKEGITKNISGTEFEAQFFKDFNIKMIESYLDHLKSIQNKLTLIKLNLNPKEELHLKLNDYITVHMNLFNSLPQNKSDEIKKTEIYKKLKDSENKLIYIIQRLVKLEWEKTKRPFILRQYYFYFGNGKKILNEALSIN